MNYWQDVVTKFYASCNTDISDIDSFDATICIHDFGIAEISKVQSTSIQYERRPIDIRLNPSEYFIFAVNKDKGGLLSQNDRCVIQNPGDVLIFESSKPYNYQFPESYESTLLRIPRSALESKIYDLDSLGGSLFERASPHGRIVGNLISDICFIARQKDLNHEMELIESSIDMIACTINNRRSGLFSDTISSHQKLFIEIKKFVSLNITDPDLTLEKISQHFGISIRTLSRVFSEYGETPRNWLQEKRLSSAYHALANKKASNVTQAALTFGFKDLSHFNRSFKKRFGHSASSLLR